MTENGALGYKTSGKALLDLNYMTSSLRNGKDDYIIKLFSDAYYENRLYAVKWMFFAGDVRGGMGERRIMRVCLKYLAERHTDDARKILNLVPDYTRWDNLFCLFDTLLRSDALKIIKTQLEADIANAECGKPISLLAKWLPSINASSNQAVGYAKTIIEYLGYTNKQYRRTLSMLREKLLVVEVAMSAKKWSTIKYDAVPSRANLIYNEAFLRNDEQRRRAFLKALSEGKTKINAATLFPHEIVSKYQQPFTYHGRDIKVDVDVALEEMWKALPDYAEDIHNTICVADGSGSMLQHIGNTSISALDVANGLAIYFAERCSGEFRDKFITFSDNPQLVDLGKARNLAEKIEIAYMHDEIASTNLEAVFDLILATAVEHNLKQKDIPHNVLILSDMEFNQAVNSLDEENFERLFTIIGRKYAEHGYLLPRIIFWNILNRTQTVPLRQNQLGVSLVSGFSPASLKMVLSNKFDPYECLLENLDSERYAPVEKAYNS